MPAMLIPKEVTVTVTITILETLVRMVARPSQMAGRRPNRLPGT